MHGETVKFIYVYYI